MRPLALIVLLTACSQNVDLRFRTADSRQRTADPVSAPAVCCPLSAVLNDSPDAAAAYFAAKRGNVDVVAHWSAAREQLQHRNVMQVLQPAQPWTYLGPGNIGGRTRPLLIDPVDNDTMYAGAVSGGVFKTIDGGRHWSAAGDVMANLAVCSLAMSPADRKTLFAGTGEGYFREDVRGTALPIRGDGIFVTRDGASTWSQLPSTTNNEDFYWINDLAISAHDPHRIYAATRTGVWRSNDEGASWSHVLTTSLKGGCLDLALRAGTDGDYVFASCGVFDQATVYRAKNAERDEAWTPVLSEPGMSRTSLAIAPSNPSIVYALAAKNTTDDRDQSLLAVYRSDQNGDPGTWSAQQTGDGPLPGSLLLLNPWAATLDECNDGPIRDEYVSMGWHCNVIAVDPLDADRVFAAGVDVFRSDDGGKTWGVASFWFSDPSHAAFSHADHHGIVFHPHYDGASNQTMFVTNDGGVYRTDNARDPVGRGTLATCHEANTSVRWTTLVHDFGATQFYHGAVTPDGHTFLGGAQDNGTLLGHIENGTDGWEPIWGGDGGYVAVDPKNGNNMYFESQYGALAKSTNGGTNASSAIRDTIDDFLFVTPVIFDPNESTRAWSGGRYVWRNLNSALDWTRASSVLDGNVTALAVAPGNSSFVLAGTTTGKVYRSESATIDSNVAWSSSTPRAGWIASLTFDGSTIYATYSNFGGHHIWKSTDAARTWTSIDGDLPDLPVHAVAVSPIDHRLFIGTDLGVFSSADGGAHWIDDEALPPVITEWIEIGKGANGPALYAFTHGRGVWRLELTQPGPRRRSAGR